ncbi:DEAD/DEAH box helicase family protein [Ligilactobacillus ruminis]|uniref:DEAD/DEAH box helicase family protein n=1 Tax=Ligilactobacillus ruminis TaxID=1623 RepID=UPI003F9622D2
MLPEEKARIKIDKQLNNAGWDIVSRQDYVPNYAMAIKEALMQGGNESDYLLFIDNKAIAVVEAKREENDLRDEVELQAENYAVTPEKWYGTWFDNLIPLVYLANGKKILFKNLLTDPDGDYIELKEMHSPKRMLQLINKTSEYGALPRIERKGLRDCQYNAECKFEKSIKQREKKALAILATGSGKTYLACLAAYRLLNYTQTRRVLFLADRNNLARQAETEFKLFNRTEKQQQLNDLYTINRLTKPDKINGDIIISTIQKLFAVLTGQSTDETNEDEEDENNLNFDETDEQKAESEIDLGKDIKLPSDYFQFIIVDECHRSIYGKWQSVLKYFKDAKILGLTATPTPEAYAFFNDNIIEKYTYDDSVVDGVNVPARVYRIKTEQTEHGGTIKSGDKFVETTRSGYKVNEYIAEERIDFNPTQLDRSVVSPDQIRKNIETFRDSIYTDMFPERKALWEYIPKTLIFAKDDHHASEIVDIVKAVFAEKFEYGKIPEKFVQKITYSAGDTNTLIKEFRTEKEFRIAVTVTLVATGTDVKPLEIVMFMRDVNSDVLYTQMKGRGCRTINDDKLKEVTPNATTKDCFYIVDCVGVTEHDKTIPAAGGGETGTNTPKLEKLLEYLSHGYITDDNLSFLRDYCASINRRYENNPLFGHHLSMFITNFGFSPRDLALNINKAISQNILPPFISPSDENRTRNDLISCLISNLEARKKLLELHRGYYAIYPNDDTLIEKGFSKEQAISFIENFEKYITENADSIEALRIIYNSEDTVITRSMLSELQERLLSENRSFTPAKIWRNYKLLDTDSNVDELDISQNANALTNLIQIVRYAYKKNPKLISLLKGYSQRFALYCGQAQRTLTEDQKDIMKHIADYVIDDGYISINELNEIDTDLWRKAIKTFGAPSFKTELVTLSKFLLKAA